MDEVDLEIEALKVRTQKIKNPGAILDISPAANAILAKYSNKHTYKAQFNRDSKIDKSSNTEES